MCRFRRGSDWRRSMGLTSPKRGNNVSVNMVNRRHFMVHVRRHDTDAGAAMPKAFSLASVVLREDTATRSVAGKAALSWVEAAL